MLIAAAVRAPTSVAIALFTFAVSAASLVNSPVVRLVSGCLSDAQAASANATATMKILIGVLSPAPEPARGRPVVADRTAISPVAGCPWRLGAGFPVLHLALGLVARAAVPFLDLADELVAVARHLVDLVVRELAPLLA